MLKVFNLSHNGLGDDGALAFIDALKVNTTLTELDVRYMYTNTPGVCSLHGHSLHTHSNNRFSSTTAVNFAIKVIPSCETLKVLRVSHCRSKYMAVYMCCQCRLVRTQCRG